LAVRFFAPAHLGPVPLDINLSDVGALPLAVDRNTIALILSGGEPRLAAVKALFRAHSNQFRKHFIYHGVSREVAEDLVQDTFIKIIRSADDFRGDSSLEGWIWTIARNTMVDYLRSAGIKLVKNLSDDEWEALLNTDHSLRHETGQDVAQSIQDCVSRGFQEFAKIDPARAYALSMLVEGLTSDQIAEALGRAPGAIREYLSQCRKRIASFLVQCRDLLE
jgi:RNA polymerase sigma factor (sigma-70 family)